MWGLGEHPLLDATVKYNQLPTCLVWLDSGRIIQSLNWNWLLTYLRQRYGLTLKVIFKGYFHKPSTPPSHLPISESQEFKVKQASKANFFFCFPWFPNPSKSFYSLFMPSPTHYFLNFNILQNIPEGLLKNRLLELIHRVYNSIGLGWDQWIYISNKFPWMRILILLIHWGKSLSVFSL